MSGKLSDTTRNNLIQLREKADAFVEGVSRSYPAEIPVRRDAWGVARIGGPSHPWRLRFSWKPSERRRIGTCGVKRD